MDKCTLCGQEANQEFDIRVAKVPLCGKCKFGWADRNFFVAISVLTNIFYKCQTQSQTTL